MKSIKLPFVWFVPIAILSMTIDSAAADERLVDAVKSDDIRVVRTLLKQKVDINAAGRDGMTALHWAAHGDQVALVDLLLSAGAKPGMVNLAGLTPLSLAIENGNPTIVERLLQGGANVNLQSAGETALHVAAHAGSVAIAKLLVARGATIDAREKWYAETPLMVAAGQHQVEMVKFLIEAGADVNAMSAVSTLINGPGSPNQTFTQTPRGGLTPLAFAARDGCQKCAELLLQAGANVNYEDPTLVTPLNLAVYNAHFDLAAYLLQRGANADDDSLYLAVQVRNLGPERTSGQVRPNPRGQNTIGALDLIRLLVAKSADPNRGLTRDIQSRSNSFERTSEITGFTPLQRAAASADLEVMRLLLDRGADPNRLTMSQEARLDGPDWGGNLALHLAVGAFGPRELAYRRIERDDPTEAVKLLLDRGADVNAIDLAGMTALHLAAQRGSNTLIQLLVDRGAKLDIKDYWDRTPLVAAGGGRDGLSGFSPPRPARPQSQTLLRRLMGIDTASTGAAGKAESAIETRGEPTSTPSEPPNREQR